MRMFFSSMLAFGLMTCSVAMAQGLTVVKHLDDFTCMSLNLTEQQLMDGSVPVQVRAAPEGTAPSVGVAAATVAVRKPVKPVNGFVEMLFPDGRGVWIKANMLHRWKSLNNPRAKCFPAMMSNGRPGFDFTG